ncbi:unnamed protein product, partial [Mesorhabditis spiculigera]
MGDVEEVKRKEECKEIERELSTGREKTRMCMEQYDRILSTHRAPNREEDVTTSPTLPRFDCYLCYGAVVNDGYGCAYNIQEDHLIFAPTAFKSCAKTSAAKFKEAIRSSLHDMATLLEGGQR